MPGIFSGIPVTERASAIRSLRSNAPVSKRAQQGLNFDLGFKAPRVKKEKEPKPRETRAFRRFVDLQKQIQAETAPFRQAGLGLLGRFQGAPGETEFFRQGLDVGGAQLAQQFAKFGLLDSSTSGLGFGQLTSGLLAQEEALRQQALGTAAGLGQTGFGLLGGLAGQEFALASRVPPPGIPSTQGAQIGGLLGTGTGFALGGPAGALIGGGLGAGVGGLFD
jgi:hypothetical protein